MDPQQQTPPPAPAMPPAPKPENGKGTLWTILAIILSIVAVALIALAIYMYVSGKSLNQIIGRGATPADEGDDGDDSSGDGEDEDAEDEDEEDEEALVPFTGDTITAEAPEEWTITEYYDGDQYGTTTLTTGVAYSGLTGITVSNPDDEVVFNLTGVYGIGGTDACSQFYQFSDTDPDYYDEIVALSAIDEIVPTIVDHSGDDYSAYDLLGLSVRRVDTSLFWDTSAGAETFDPGCGITYYAWELSPISFEGDGTTIHTYHAVITAGTPDAELLILDDILASIEVLP